MLILKLGPLALLGNNLYASNPLGNFAKFLFFDITYLLNKVIPQVSLNRKLCICIEEKTSDKSFGLNFKRNYSIKNKCSNKI